MRIRIQAICQCGVMSNSLYIDRGQMLAAPDYLSEFKQITTDKGAATLVTHPMPVGRPQDLKQMIIIYS
jgi:hypothetical protein